jgi:hypothetical protein
MGDKVCPITNYPNDSKPFWASYSTKDLQCFVCDFMQKWSKTFEGPTEVHWMSKRIKKHDESLVISFRPSCLYGKPWIVHSQSSYTTIHIAEERTEEGPLVTAKTSPKVDKKWTTSDFFEKPYD